MKNAIRFLAFWLVGATSVGNACTIDPRSISLSDIEGTYSRSDVVLVGEIVAVDPIDSGWTKVTIRVSERLKRDVGDLVSLAATTSRGSCNPHINLGAKYIVFAQDRPIAPPASPPLLDEAAAASSAIVATGESTDGAGNTVAAPLGEATDKDSFINSIANLRGMDPSGVPSAPWEGDFVLRATLEADSTEVIWRERVQAAIAKMRSLRADGDAE
jgi:hypothetical protein